LESLSKYKMQKHLDAENSFDNALNIQTTSVINDIVKSPVGKK